MKKSTKILLILYILVLIPSIVLGKYIFRGIKPNGESFEFAFDVYGYIGLALSGLALALGTILFFRLIASVSLEKAIFFSSTPLVVAYGLIMFLLAQISSYQNITAQTVRNILNVTADNNYNTILWAILISLVFIALLFLNFFIICKPVSKMEKIVVRLGDGKVKSNRLRIGGGKQFANIEHGLNKINQNYKTKDHGLNSLNMETQKFIPKEIFRFLGKNSISELELGNQVEKSVTTMLIKLGGISNSAHLSPEENFHFLNAYIHVITPLVRRFNGFVDNYLGEGLVAVFKTPQDALNCAHASIRAIEIKNRQNKSLPNVNTRISILSGTVVFGVVGDDDRKMPGIVSDVVTNLEKLDESARLIHAKVIFNKSVLDELPLDYKFMYRYVGKATLSDGRESELFEDLENYPRDKIKGYVETRLDFEKAVVNFEKGDYALAFASFENLLKRNPNDKCAYIYFNKSKDKI